MLAKGFDISELEILVEPSLVTDRRARPIPNFGAARRAVSMGWIKNHAVV
jgi:hypothetical protein